VIPVDKLVQGIYFAECKPKRHKNPQEVVLDRRRSKSKQTQKNTEEIMPDRRPS
jgi:hypothetical protein